MLRPALATTLLCAFVASATAAPEDAGLAGRIDPVVRDMLQRTHTPATNILVVQGGKRVFEKAYGLRDLQDRVPADVGTHYEIGSITKQFTAAAILQLKEAGKLDLDATLATYIPGAPHAGEVTLRQLLAQTSGMPDYFDGPDVDVAAGKPTSFDTLMARVAGKPLDFTPGTKWAYSNTNYILLGRVIEVVSHETYHHYIQAHLLDPLGLKQTFTLADERRVPDMALGYRRADGKLSLAPPLDEGFGWAAGDLISTLTDLEKWSEALAGGKVVTPADYVLMTTEVPIKDGTSGYGFAQFLDSVDDQPRIGHTGGALGFTSADEYFPRQDTRIIVFTNLTDDPEPGERFNTGVFEALFPGIAAAADRPAAGEDAAVTAKARALFIALQQGTADSSMLGARLAAKMQSGLGQRLAGEFAPYGAPTAVIFKGHRTDGGLSWSDYVLKFGPGSSFKFSIALDDSGKIISMGFG